MGHGVFLRPQIEAGTDPPIGTSEDTNFDKSQVRAGLKKNTFSFGSTVYSRVNYSLQCQAELSCSSARVWLWLGRRREGKF